MRNEKKCPNCGKWSEWNNSLGDKCTFCKELLSPIELEQQEEKVGREEKQEKEWVFNYDANTPLHIKIYKQIGNAIYTVIMAIVGFITWLLLWLGP